MTLISLGLVAVDGLKSIGVNHHYSGNSKLRSEMWGFNGCKNLYPTNPASY